MTLPPIMPDWVPWWAQLALLVVAMLFAFALLMMPFAVFGLKGRLDLIEAQLDDIHAELRMLAMRLPDVEPVRLESRRALVEPDTYEQPAVMARRPAPARTEGRGEARSDGRPQAQSQPQFRAEGRTAPVRADDDRLTRREEPRETIRDAGRDPGRDRSEPRLRWPPDGR
jgi:hypothetical protein